MTQRWRIALAFAAVGGSILNFAFPWKVSLICFGDLCPHNGGLYVEYRHAYSEAECVTRGANPIVGMGWSRVYAGCSPFENQLITGSKVPRLVAALFN